MTSLSSRLSYGTAGPSSAAPGAATRVPEYQPAQSPMTPEAQRKLDLLHQNRNIGVLTKSYNEAIGALSLTVAEINERLSECQHKIDKQRSRKRKQPTDDPNTEEPDDLATGEKHLEKFKEDVQGMTKRMDESIRKLIDNQETLNHTREALLDTTKAAKTNASTQATLQATAQARESKRRQAGSAAQANEEDEEEDDEHEEEQYPEITPTDPAGVAKDFDGPSVFYKKRSDELKLLYQSRELHDRYGHNDDYRSFRNLLHNAQYPDESVPLPPVEAWFEEGGLARPGVTQRGGDDDDEEEDIQISRATTSTKCPITLQEFRKPITAKQCSHTFETEAIKQMIQQSTTRVNQVPGRHGPVGGQPAVRCPVQSCDNIIAMAELHTDPAIVRRIQRLQRAREAADDEMNDDTNVRDEAEVIDDDEDDALDIDQIESDENVPDGTQIKAELSGRRRR